MLFAPASKTTRRGWCFFQAFCWCVLLCGWGLPRVAACKYSVRDVAFVDLDRQGFEWIVTASRAELDVLRPEWQPTSQALFLDSNLQPRWLDLDQTDRWPSFLDPVSFPAGASFHLYRPGLPLLDVSPSTSPEGMEQAQRWTHLEGLVKNPLRERLIDQLMEAYAVILLVEGKQAEENQRVAQAAQRAASFIEELMPDMPKPVDVPPQVIMIPHQDIGKERALIWSLGMDWQETEEPQASILIGRGRRLGPALKGDAITSVQLQEMLAVAGQDCECDLDRSWMQGPRMPMAWGPERQQASYQWLGFDPENPLVKAEISRILSRGRNAIRVGSDPHDTQGLDMLLLGYSEEVIGLEPTASNVSEGSASQGEARISAAKEVPDQPILVGVDSPTSPSNDSADLQQRSEATKAPTESAASDLEVEPARSSFKRPIQVMIGFSVLVFLGGFSLWVARKKNHGI